VRSLEREISKICRKVVKGLLLKSRDKKIAVTPKNLDKYLGVRRYTYGMAEKANQVGQVTGLAWTEVGGDLLTIEAIAVPGKGKTTTTGKLGDVMTESIAGGDVGGAQSREVARHRRGLLREEGHPHSTCRRCDAEGRTVGGHRHRDGHRRRC
jgi:ATP-dependent Lon protease